MLVLLSYLVSNLIFEFCLRLIQCKFLIDLESIPIWWYKLRFLELEMDGQYFLDKV